MKDLLRLLAHLLTTLAKLLGPGGARAIVADSLLMKQQLLIINRSRQRAPNLTAIDRVLLGFWSLFLSPHHIKRAAVILRPSTLLKFHDMLKNRKYRLLYSSGRQGTPGPKGPSRGYCQVNEIETAQPINNYIPLLSGHNLGARHRLPFTECPRAKLAIVNRSRQMPTQPEQIAYHAINRKKALSLSS